jgi:hypothetical protein
VRAAAEAAAELGLRVFVQPFRVICETCHARLKVSNASAIGEIHACPKCGSMVEIRPPADGFVPPPSTAGSASIEIGVSAAATFDHLVVPPAEVASPPAPVMPANGRTSLLWWGVGGGVTVLVAGGLAALALFDGSQPPPAQSAPVSNVQEQYPAHTESGFIANEELTHSVSDAELTVVPEAANDASPTEDAPAEQADPAAALPLSPAVPPAETTPATETATNELPVAATSTGTLQAPPSPAEKPRPQPVMTLDPLDFDPSQFSFDEADTVPATPNANSIPKNADVEVNAGDGDAGSSDAQKVPPQAGKVDRSLSVRLGPIPDANVPPHRAAEQLATRLESLVVADMPLCRFVELLTDMADVAVTLDPIELELAGVTPHQKAGIDAKEVTVEKVLRDVFTKHRLDLVERDGHLGIALAGGDTKRAITYDVADLAGTADATSLAQLIERFVAPDSWNAADGGGSIKVEKSKIRIDQIQRVRHEVLIFLERLRLARGLSQRSRYPASLLATISPHEAAAPRLQQRATFTLLPWTRLGDVLRHWQDASKLTILVDWRALAAMELEPPTPMACSAIDRSWEDTLDGILEPIGLAWWPVNGETIQITSQEALDGIRRIEFYRVPQTLRDQHATMPAVIESLQQAVAEIDAKLPAVIDFDEPSERLIVLAEPRVHRLLHKRLRVPPL